MLFGLVAGLGGLGFLVSLGAGLWANVERKRIPLAQLRFLGLRAGSLRLFPMAQAAVLAMLGVAAASAAALAASVLVNRVFAGALALDRPLCLITPATGGHGGGNYAGRRAAGCRRRRHPGRPGRTVGRR